MNLVILMGNLTADPEGRATPAGPSRVQGGPGPHQLGRRGAGGGPRRGGRGRGPREKRGREKKKGGPPRGGGGAPPAGALPVIIERPAPERNPGRWRGARPPASSAARIRRTASAAVRVTI